LNIAVDAMGGDHAPAAVVAGALEAAHLFKGTISLVGDPAAIMEHLPKPVPTNINIVPATQVVTMDDKPLDALRKKKDSSLVVAVNMVHDGTAQAMVSAGNTGAATAASLLVWRPISGIHRPAISSLFPNKYGHFLLLDAGASPDVGPEQMVEFAVMGRVYAEHIMGIENPHVHLLNIGEEPGKGNAFAKKAFELLSDHSWFVGNIEGKDLFRERVHVVVCDAFVGNIVLKTAEGVAEYIMSSIREEMPTSKLAQLPYLPLRKLLAPLKKKTDYAEYGGMPLLGLNGLTFICHGRSNARAMKNAILGAGRAIEADLMGHMRTATGFLSK